MNLAFLKIPSYKESREQQPTPSLSYLSPSRRGTLKRVTSQTLHERQAKQQFEEGSIFRLVSVGEETDEALQELKDRVAADAAAVDTDTDARIYPYMRDEAGATLLHLAVLHRNYRMAHFLIEEFGEVLVKAQYEPEGSNASQGLYDGETALHLAIVNRSHRMVRLLLRNGADVSARATGQFFR